MAVDLVQVHIGKEIDASALDQFLIADRRTHAFAFTVGLPVRPGALRRRVVDELVQVSRNLDLIASNSWARWREHRSGDHVDISTGAQHVAPCILLDLGLGSAVVLDVLRDHIGQGEALRH